MKLRNAVMYRYKEFTPFLGVIIAFSVLQYVLTVNQGPLADFILAFAKCLLFFAMGMKSFKEPYKYLLQNGYKNLGIYYSFLLFVPSTLIVSAIINIASYFIRSQNDYFTQIFADTNLGLAESDMKTFLVFKIISCAAVFSLSLIFGYFCSMLFYKFNSKMFRFIGFLGVAAIFTGVIVLMLYCESECLLSAYYIPAFVMLFIPVTVIIATLGYLFCKQIELERSR